MTVEAQRAGPAFPGEAGPFTHARARELALGDVVMSECVAGVSVTMRLSSRRFIGVMTRENPDDPAETEIALLRNDGHAVVLAVAGDGDVVAEWRAASRNFGLPMVVQRPDCGVIALEAMIGSVMLGKAQSCRRMRALTRNRRPRFLTRRQTSRLPSTPIIHRPSEALRKI